MNQTIFFVTDVQCPAVLQRLLNEPDSIVSLEEEAAANEKIRNSTKKHTSFKQIFRLSKSLSLKKKKKKQPETVDELRKVVFFSNQQKAHYEMCVDEQRKWTLGPQIEEEYVRNLKTLRIVPWMQSIYLQKEKRLKKEKKKQKKALLKAANKKPPLFPKPAKKPSIFSKKHKKDKKSKRKSKDIFGKPTDDNDNNSKDGEEAGAARLFVETSAPNSAPQHKQNLADGNSNSDNQQYHHQAAAAAQHEATEDTPVTPKTPKTPVQVVASANDLFGDDGNLRSPQNNHLATGDPATAASTLRGPTVLGPAGEDHREAFPEGPPRPWARSSHILQKTSWSTWPPNRSRTDAAKKREEERDAALAGGAGKGDGAAAAAAHFSCSRTMAPSRRNLNSHELTLRNIVGADDEVLAWEVKREDATGDEAAKLTAARENMEHQVLVEEENEAARRERERRARERRRQAAEAAKAREAMHRRRGEQAALQAEQERLRVNALRDLEAAVAKERAARAEAEAQEAAVKVLYPTTIVRGGSNHLQRQQQMVQEQQHQESLQHSMRSRPEWWTHVSELADMGAVSMEEADKVLERYNGSLKAAKLFYYQRMF